MSDMSFQSGDILMDWDLFLIANTLITYGLGSPLFAKGSEERIIHLFAQLVETIVINERLVFDRLVNTSVKSTFVEKIAVLLPNTDDIPVFYDDIEASNSNMSSDEDTGHSLTIRFPSKIKRIVYLAEKYGLSLRCTDSHSFNNRYSDMGASILDKIKNVANDDISVTNEYVKSYFTLDVPIIFNYIVERAHTRREIIDQAFELRSTPEAEAFRKQLTLLDEAAAVDDRKVILQILGEIDDKIKSLNKKVSQPSSGLSIAIPYQIGINVDTIKEILEKNVLRHRKRHLLFIEQMYDSAKQARSVRRHLGKLL